MRTAAQVGAMGRHVGADSPERSGTLGAAAMLAAIAAALLFVLGSAWFSVGAGENYPEAPPAWTD